MVRWEVGTGESPEVSRPSSLVYMTGNKRPTPKILLEPPPYAHCGVCTSLISLHTHAYTHTDERMFTLTTNFEFFIFSYFKGLEELYQDFQNKTKINQAIKDYLGTRI